MAFSGSNFSVGDKVKILSDKSRVKSLQDGHGEWISVMEQTLGETGKVKAVLPNGDLRVKVLGTVFTFNPKSVVKPDDDSDDDSKDIGSMLLMALLASNLEAGMGLGGGSQAILLKAAASGDTPKVRELLNKGVNVNQSIKGTTALHAAANKGHLEIVRMLIEKGADQQLMDDDNDSALHCAIHGGRVEVVRFLLSKRAPLNSKNKKELSPLHLSVLGDNKSITQLLLAAGADRNTQDEAGDTPVHDVIDKKNIDLLRLLLDKGASVTIINNRGFNALHWAALKDNNEAVRIILQRHRTIVDITKDDGYTALHLAATNDHPQVSETLLSVGSANPNIKNKNGQTPLILAAVDTYVEVVKVLISESTQLNLDVKDKDGDTALHEVLRRADKNDSGDAERLLAALHPLFGLLNGSNGDTEAAKEIAILLVQSGADVKLRNNKGQTAFDLCSDNDFKLRLSHLITGTQRSSQNQDTSTVGAMVTICGICKRKKRDTVFQCGHMFCEACSKVNTCPTCKQKVTQKIKVFG